MIEHRVVQNTPEWMRLRAGIPTASAFDRIITPKGLKLSAARENYLDELLAEWIQGCPSDNPQTPHMRDGHDREEQTAAAYELRTGLELEPCGFYTTDDGRAGASPDRRVVGVNRGVEVKSPQLKHHVAYMRGAGLYDEHRIQIYGQIWVCKFEGVDITSWNELVPASAVVIVQAHRDDTITEPKTNKEIGIVETIAAAVNQFCNEIAEAKIQIEQKYGKIAKPMQVALSQSEPDPFGITEEDLEAYIAAKKPLWSESNG